MVGRRQEALPRDYRSTVSCVNGKARSCLRGAGANQDELPAISILRFCVRDTMGPFSRSATPARPPTPSPGGHVGEADGLFAGDQKETSCYLLTVHPCTP